MEMKSGERRTTRRAAGPRLLVKFNLKNSFIEVVNIFLNCPPSLPQLIQTCVLLKFKIQFANVQTEHGIWSHATDSQLP